MYICIGWTKCESELHECSQADRATRVTAKENRQQNKNENANANVK